MPSDSDCPGQHPSLIYGLEMSIPLLRTCVVRLAYAAANSASICLRLAALRRAFKSESAAMLPDCAALAADKGQGRL
jgi:hypothetical protein